MDVSLCPALAMIGSHAVASVRYAMKTREDLARAIERVPLAERKRSWSMLMFNASPGSGPGRVASAHERSDSALRAGAQ